MAGGATGSGTVPLLAPSTSTNRTINLPDSNGTMATAESTLTQFNATGSAPVYACRAWVNFNGTGTVAIRASGNVSSITDVGVGIYTVNFTTAMPDANYSVATNAGDVGATQFDRFVTPFSFATGSVSITVRDGSSGLADNPLVALTVFR